jgi:hypothetical protein
MVRTIRKTGFPTVFMTTLILLLGFANLHYASSQNLPERETGSQAGETNYALSEGFRSIKWATRLADAKKVYPDLLFVEQIPRTEPKYFYYRKKNESKQFSGLDWDSIRYVFVNNQFFISADLETRLELGDRDKAIAHYNELYQSIVAKYGKPWHAEKTDQEGYPFVYASIWRIGSERVDLQLKSLKDHWIYKKDKLVETRISMLEFTLHLSSEKGERKGIDF